MKKYRIELNSDQMDIFEKTMHAVIARVKRDPSRLLETGLAMEDLLAAFEKARSEPEEVAKKRTVKQKDTFQPKLCPDHPTYTATRPPTIDCSGHWEAYKKMNPLKYDQARAKFERKAKSE